MTGKDKIQEILKKVVKDLTQEEVQVDLQISDKSGNGDYYTNVAMRLAGILKEKPLDIAYKIKDLLEKELDKSLVSKVEVAPPGFINFFFTDEALLATMDVVVRQGKYGDSDSLKNKKVMIEYTDPNPFKEFHIGHLYSNIVGESLSRLFKSQGAEVASVTYQGDVGLHVAKAIYGMQKIVDQMPDDSAPLAVRAQFMGKAYALGAKEFEENEATANEIKQLNKKIYEQDKSIIDLYTKGRAWSLEYFDSIYKKLGSKFEKNYFESEVMDFGLEFVREYLKKGIFEESDGAVIFPGKKYGLHNRVFINSLGLPTYEAKDLGLAPTKYKDFKYDISVIVTAEEQSHYFRVVFKALEQINPDLANKTIHVAHGMVRLPSGKMSSRTGNVITGEWLVDEAVARINKEYPEMDTETAEKVGVAAIKYAFLKATIGKDVEFNFDESISLSGASGPYLQYTYVRTQSVLEKSKSVSMGDKTELNDEEKDILRSLVYFPEIVASAQEKLSPNLIATYLFELSQKYNLFYQKHKISENTFRIELTKAVGRVLKNGLNLLGIETVDRM